MRSFKDLQDELKKIDGRGYKAYEDIRGQYKFQNYILSIDHVQGDPFAPPSKARVAVSQYDAKFPVKLFDTPCKRIAVVDFLTRLFEENIKKYYQKVYGTGKSGLLTIDSCGQEILDRTSIVIDETKVEARFEIGLPASGRTVMGKSAAAIFFEALPRITANTLFYDSIDKDKLQKQVNLSIDQDYLRKHLEDKELIAFIANGSILPRESGISSKPLRKEAVPFRSPDSMKVEFNLPIKGSVKGMGIKKGITLIVGGGYHGKSTLLKALELGVYNHIEGDGREYVVSVQDAVKIRAEDGRRIEKVDISPFIKNLPSRQDTERFSTENASGSTSQAANIMEALEVGTSLILIDEDTSATNFMVRDEKMQRLVSNDREPITPFINRVRHLYDDLGVSTILVAGSSGDYFDIADTIIMMEEYNARDATFEAKKISKEHPYSSEIITDEKLKVPDGRVLLKSSFPEGRKGARIKASGLDTILYEHSKIDLNYLEQLADTNQTNCIAVIMEYIMDKLADDNLTINEITERIMKIIEEKGLDEISPFTGHPGNLAKPRKFEIAGALNRFRSLNITRR